MSVGFPRGWLPGILICVAACGLALGQGKGQGRGQGGQAHDQDGPAARLSLILGRPTDRSVTLSVLSAVGLEAFAEWGVATGTFTGKSPTVAIKAGEPAEIELGGLEPDTKYVYRLRTRTGASGEFAAGEECSFHTQRAPGQTFTFALQGDSHPERAGRMFDADLYVRTMGNVAKDAPDFYILMGDDFSIDPLIERNACTKGAVDRVYAHQRGFLGVVGQSSPLFLVNGNHEEAAKVLLDATAVSPAALAGKARTTFFPLPAPDSFYTGNSEPVEHVGLPRDYYAWTWGDALFVVIDPYWHSSVQVDAEPGGGKPVQGGAKTGKGGVKNPRDMWGITLGDTQYHWLEKTLRESRAKFKFVFCHHVLGTGRGGIECAERFEWGGRDNRGVDAFAQHRPGWDKPIQALFKETGVTIFFQGHDHLYARQELDGVVYQEVPNPADPTFTAFNRDAYRSGDIFPNSGHLRVTVSPQGVRVDYVRSLRPGDEKDGLANATIVHSYTIGGDGKAESRAQPATPQAQPDPSEGKPAAPDTRKGQGRKKDAKGRGGEKNNGEERGRDDATFHTDVPSHPFDLVLVRPTPTSIGVSVLTSVDVEGRIEFGESESDAASTKRSGTQTLRAGEPALFTLEGLKPDSAYTYRWRYRPTGAKAPAASREFANAGPFSFHTPRKPGASFTFAIQADSHLDSNVSPDVYLRTLGNIAADAPDFLVDLGDTFMIDKRRDFHAALPQYAAQRYYFGQVCTSAPLFMALGNHDGEYGYGGAGADEISGWSYALRTKFFPPPIAPGPMYTGRTTLKDGVGSNYFSFQWGDALVVVLDPFWPTSEKLRGGRAGSERAAFDDRNWALTLGREQYDWLDRTLAASKAKFKFVFIHHLVGGRGSDSRGGVESAPYFEWGGKNADGSDGFAAHRSGWPMPIHALLVARGVSAVFHGHDHLFVHAELDGISYQCVPQPGTAHAGANSADEYGYEHGTILSSPGHLRVAVSSDQARVEYVRSVLADRQGRRRRPSEENGSVVSSYSLKPSAAARD